MFDTVRARFTARGRRVHAGRRHHRRAQPPDLPGLERREPCTPGVDCADCPNRQTTDGAIQLCQLAPGEAGRIVAVYEGRRFRKRLADLGLTVGMDVQVVRASHGRGPLILAICNDSRLALGWGVASKILVERRPEGAHA